MESTNINTRVETAIPMARFSIGEDDEDAPLTIKRPRLSESASQSRRPVPRCQSRVVAEEDDEQEVHAQIEDVESDSEEDDENEELELEEEEDEEEEVEVFEHIESEDDVSDHREAEQQQIAPSALLQGLSNVVVASRTVSDDLNGELHVVLTDPDVLDCPICLDPLTTPVFQCENGHIACSLCCTKVNRKCPSCCMPIGYNRCRAIEKVIESIKVSCKNAKYGCQKTMTYSKKIEHEQICPHATCFCPHPSCHFAASSKNMYLHFGMQHAASTTRFTYNTTFFVHVTRHQKHIFLQEQHESVVFVLNHQVKEHDRALNVDCVGPSSLKTAFEYQITARSMESTLSLQCVPETYTRWVERPLKKNYLTIPSDFFGFSGTLPLHLCIKKVVSPI